MKNLFFIKYIITLLLIFTAVAFAQNDFPTGYQFWTEDRRSMLQVRCMPTDDNSGDINCEMITTIFFPKAKSEDLNKALKNGWHKEIFDDNGEIKDKKTSTLKSLPPKKNKTQHKNGKKRRRKKSKIDSNLKE